MIEPGSFGNLLIEPVHINIITVKAIRTTSHSWTQCALWHILRLQGTWLSDFVTRSYYKLGSLRSCWFRGELAHECSRRSCWTHSMNMVRRGPISGALSPSEVVDGGRRARRKSGKSRSNAGGTFVGRRFLSSMRLRAMARRSISCGKL